MAHTRGSLIDISLIYKSSSEWNCVLAKIVLVEGREMRETLADNFLERIQIFIPCNFINKFVCARCGFRTNMLNKGQKMYIIFNIYCLITSSVSLSQKDYLKHSPHCCRNCRKFHVFPSLEKASLIKVSYFPFILQNLKWDLKFQNFIFFTLSKRVKYIINNS